MSQLDLRVLDCDKSKTKDYNFSKPRTNEYTVSKVFLLLLRSLCKLEAPKLFVLIILLRLF